MSSPEKAPSTAGALARALWFPAFFVIGFMVFYLLPFHAAAPHHMPIAVVGEQAASGVGGALEQASPGGFDISAVASGDAARSAVLDRDTVAAFDPGSGTLYVAGAEGQQVSQAAQHVFSPVAAQSGQSLRVVDLAPTALGDALGTSLFYIVMAWNIAGYIVVMMMMQAAELATRTKLAALVGFGACAALVPWLFGLAVNAIGSNPAVLLVGFLTTQAVAWTTFGLAPLVRRALPGVAMGLFVLLSIPSSDGALSKWMVPAVFRWLHYVMPLGNAVDAARAIMYFGGQGWVRPVLVLLGWIVLGVALLVLGARRAPAAAGVAAEASAEDQAAVGGAWVGTGHQPAAEPEREPEREPEHRSGAVVHGRHERGDQEHGDHERDHHKHGHQTPAPAIVRGRVGTREGGPAVAAVVTVTDDAGRQVGRAAVDQQGRFRVEVPRGPVTVLVHGPGYHPVTERVIVEETTAREYRLTPTRNGSELPAHTAAATAALS